MFLIISSFFRIMIYYLKIIIWTFPGSNRQKNKNVLPQLSLNPNCSNTCLPDHNILSGIKIWMQESTGQEWLEADNHNRDGPVHTNPDIF